MQVGSNAFGTVWIGVKWLQQETAGRASLPQPHRQSRETIHSLDVYIHWEELDHSISGET